MKVNLIQRYVLPSIVIILFIQGCASFYKLPPTEPLSTREITEILKALEEQEIKVNTFYSKGTVSAGSGLWAADSNFLAVGTKKPFRLRIEVSHSWGKPLLYILIENNGLKVLSFRDRTLFIGSVSSESLSRFLPVELDMDLLWGVLRGFPVIAPDSSKMSSWSFVSERGDHVKFIDRSGNIISEAVFYQEGYLPKSIFFPVKEIRLDYRDYKIDRDLPYGSNVKVDWKDGKRRFVFETDKIKLNERIPEEIFVLNKPQGFNTVFLEDL